MGDVFQLKGSEQVLNKDCLQFGYVLVPAVVIPHSLHDFCNNFQLSDKIVRCDAVKAIGFCNLFHWEFLCLHDFNVSKVNNTVLLLEDDVAVVEVPSGKRRVWMEVFEDCLTVFNLS